MDRAEVEARTGIFLRAMFDPVEQDKADALGKAVIAFLCDFERLTIATLRPVGWMNLNDHSLTEMDTDEDWAPPDHVPVWALGRTAVNVPALVLDDEDADEDPHA